LKPRNNAQIAKQVMMDRCGVFDHDHDHHEDDDIENSGRRREPPPASMPREFYCLQHEAKPLNLKTAMSVQNNPSVEEWRTSLVKKKGHCRRGCWKMRMIMSNRGQQDDKMKRTTFTTSDCNHSKTHEWEKILHIQKLRLPCNLQFVYGYNSIACCQCKIFVHKTGDEPQKAKPVRSNVKLAMLSHPLPQQLLL
jgi:hypothetical protein